VSADELHELLDPPPLPPFFDKSWRPGEIEPS
jgi:hypothetical protein